MCCHCPLLSAMLPSDIPSFLGVLYPISTLFSRPAPKPERQPGSISVWQRDGTLHIEGPLTDWHHKLLMRRSLLVTTQKGVAWKEGSIKHISFHSESRSYVTYDDDAYSKAFIQFVWSFCSRGNITNSSSICSYYFDHKFFCLLLALVKDPCNGFEAEYCIAKGAPSTRYRLVGWAKLKEWAKFWLGLALSILF